MTNIFLISTTGLQNADVFVLMFISVFYVIKRMGKNW
jgi:hypothetical protein